MSSKDADRIAELEEALQMCDEALDIYLIHREIGGALVIKDKVCKVLAGDGSAVADVVKAAQHYRDVKRQFISISQIENAERALIKALDRLPGGHDA